MTASLLPHRKPDLVQQMKCVRREISMREQVYPRWVVSGKLKQETADYEIEAMRAVLDTLEAAWKLQK